jgi:hypothetical protein
VIGLDRPEIPPRPTGIPAIVPGGPDPLLNVSTAFAARGTIITVPVLLDRSDGLHTVDLALSYDTSRLEVLAVERGSLIADFDLVGINLDREAGTIQAGIARTAGPIQDRGGGSVLLLTFRVRDDAPPGTALINLRRGLGLLTTQLNEGGLDLIPDPSDEAGDVLDGWITLLPEDVRTDASEPGGLAENALQTAFGADWEEGASDSAGEAGSRVVRPAFLIDMVFGQYAADGLTVAEVAALAGLLRRKRAAPRAPVEELFTFPLAPGLNSLR